MNEEEKSSFHGEKVDFSGSKNPLVIISEDAQSSPDGMEDQNPASPLIPNTSNYSSVLRKPIPVIEFQEIPQRKKQLIHRPRRLEKQRTMPSLNLTISNVSLSLVRVS